MRRPRTRRRGQAGFNIVELMIGLTVLLIGISGVLTLQIVSLRATSYSRHATEAAVLAEDKLEALRTIPIATLVDGVPGEQVDAQGYLDASAPFTRSWTIVWNGSLGLLTVTVSWNEGGDEPHSITYRTLRTN
jgi:prepilin-type N-terminal cleavage/methylation domain-containing protein